MRTSFVAAAALAFLAAMTCPQATAISLQGKPPKGGVGILETPEEAAARHELEKKEAAEKLARELAEDKQARKEMYQMMYDKEQPTNPEGGEVKTGPHKEHWFDQNHLGGKEFNKAKKNLKWT